MHIKLAKEWDQLLNAIRNLTGFADFSPTKECANLAIRGRTPQRSRRPRKPLPRRSASLVRIFWQPSVHWLVVSASQRSSWILVMTMAPSSGSPLSLTLTLLRPCVMVSSCLKSLAFSVCINIRYEPRYTVLEALKQYIRRITCPSLRDIEFWDRTLQAGVADIDQVFSINLKFSDFMSM